MDSFLGDCRPQSSGVHRSGATSDSFAFVVEELRDLLERHYTKNLPTISETISFNLGRGTPYMARFANHDSYSFQLSGTSLASLYDKYGEQLLQQNIRGSEGDQGTNRAIYATCTSDNASNFYHYNNGVTFLCEDAKWDQFTATISLERAQVVNGGQTIRVLHKAQRDAALRGDAAVPVRVITSKGDKEFAGDVAVNLNNQTRVESSFLRSNDPRVIQLGSSLASIGWYLERKDGELDTLTPAELTQLEERLGFSIADHTIPLKEGAQAFAATFRRLPEVAKKNPKLLFLGAVDAGYFPKVFGGDISAERFANAFRLFRKANTLISNFKSLKRRRTKMVDWQAEYAALLGEELVASTDASTLDQLVPQSVVFLTGLLFQHHVVRGGLSVDTLTEQIAVNGPSVATKMLGAMVEFSQKYPGEAAKSWPTLLKSQTFFDAVDQYVQREAAGQVTSTEGSLTR